MIRAAICDDRLSQPGRDLVQQRAHPADQRLELVFRVHALFLRPQSRQQAVVRHRLLVIQDQILHQRDALARFVDQMVGLGFIDVNCKRPHHLNSDLVAHGLSPLNRPPSRIACSFKRLHFTIKPVSSQPNGGFCLSLMAKSSIFLHRKSTQSWTAAKIQFPFDCSAVASSMEGDALRGRRHSARLHRRAGGRSGNQRAGRRGCAAAVATRSRCPAGWPARATG